MWKMVKQLEIKTLLNNLQIKKRSQGNFKNILNENPSKCVECI